jgi:hypothetical protein
MTGSTSPSAKPELKRHSLENKAALEPTAIVKWMCQTVRMLVQTHRQSAIQPS